MATKANKKQETKKQTTNRKVSTSKAKPIAKTALKSKTHTAKTHTAKTKAVKTKVAARPQTKRTAKPVARPKAAAKPAMKTIAKPAPKPMAGQPVSNVLPMKPLAKADTGKKPLEAKKNDKPAKSDFKVGSYVVYPTHGVGMIMAEESERIGDIELRVFVISFEKDKMTLRVPVHRATAAGLRSISPKDRIDQALLTLRGKARAARGMWSRRAQEYGTKINSGDIVAIAEVVRDLHKNMDLSERSYSERMIYETALGRLVGEFAAAHRLEFKTAQEKLMVVLKKQAA